MNDDHCFLSTDLAYEVNKSMKRQKRDRLARALSRGYHAGILGRPREHCPYYSLDARSHWLGGWRQAMEDRSMMA